RDIELAGQQVPGPELRAEAMLDQCVHKCFWILRLRGHHFHARDQAIAKDEDFNPHLYLFPDRVVLDAYLLDLAEKHTPEVHRRSRFESAEGFVKHDSPGFDSRVREPHGLSPVTEEGEHRIRFGWGRHRYAGWRLECNPAKNNRGQGLGVDLESARIERQVDAAGVPESRIRRDVLIVRRVDENLHGHAIAVLVQLCRRDLADLPSAEIDPVALDQRAKIVTTQYELAERPVRGEDRRDLGVGGLWLGIAWVAYIGDEST